MNTTRLNEILSLMSVSERHTLYFPPGTYFIQPKTRTSSPDLVGNVYPELARQVEDPDVRIPANVTLMMAPGAVLQLAPGVVLRIDGQLDAPISRIFDVVPGTTLDDRGVGRFGRVVIFSDDVPELYPEWWGAYNGIDGNAEMPDGLPSRASDALQRCIHAAHRDRAWPAWFKSSIPIRLQGNYFLDREVVIDDDSGPGGPLRNPQGVIVRGGRGPATANSGHVANFRPHQHYAMTSGHGGAPSRAGRALLRVQDVNGYVFDGIVFAANNQASAVLQVAGRARQNVFRNCGFSTPAIRGSATRVTRQLVQLGDYLETDREGAPQRDASGAWFTGGHDLTGTTFEACYFDVGKPEVPHFDARSDVRAVALYAWDTLPMQFLGCQFRGDVCAFIEAAGGTFVLQDCALHTGQGRTAHLDPPRLLAGMDVYLREPPARPEEHPRLSSFVATRVSSQSYQFLNTFRDPQRAPQHRSPCAVILDGVTHAQANGDSPVPEAPPEATSSHERWPPAIEWQGPGMPTDDVRRVAPLLILGSAFNAARSVLRPEQTLVPDVSMVPPGVIGVHTLSSMVFEAGSRSAVGGSLFFTFDRRDDGWLRPLEVAPTSRAPSALWHLPQLRRLG